MGEKRMVDKKLEKYIEKLDEERGLLGSVYYDLLKDAFKAGRKAQREEDGEHKVTNIGQHL